ELQRSDSRAPILFLRAFADDQIVLAKPWLPFLGRVLERGRPTTYLDHLITEEGSIYGPVVALGNPHDAFPPYGAARGYFEGATWQQAVAKLAADSSAIVICLDDTDGVWWEVEHLVAERHLDKTLFLLHPKYSRPQARDALLGLLERLSAQLAPDAAFS